MLVSAQGGFDSDTKLTLVPASSTGVDASVCWISNLLLNTLVIVSPSLSEFGVLVTPAIGNSLLEL
jgi:hypothetical protein